MFFTASDKLWALCLTFVCIRNVTGIIVLDQSPSGKPLWRESSLYRDRSHIPKPSENDRAKLRKASSVLQTSHNTKKWKIGRIFYTLPIGATFPVFYASKRGYKKGKKSEIQFSPFTTLMRERLRV